VVPGDPADRRGWWADAYAEIDGDLIGSRLWLLDRSKTTPDVVADAKAYAEEALAWLKDDEIAQKVAVRTGRSGDRLWIEVDVVRPNGGGVARYKHHNIWEALDALGTSDN
jgi:phage gp46-like protein